MDEESLLGYATSRLEQRKLDLYGVAFDVMAFVFWVLVGGRILLQSSLVYWQIDDKWAWPTFYRLFAPPIGYIFVVLFAYWQIFYGYLGLIVIYTIIALVFTFTSLVAWVWLLVDRSKCSKVLWCVQMNNFVVDDVTRQKIFGPQTSDDPRPEFIALIVVDIVIIAMCFAAVAIAWWIYSVYSEWLRTIALADKQRLVSSVPNMYIGAPMDSGKSKKQHQKNGGHKTSSTKCK